MSVAFEPKKYVYRIFTQEGDKTLRLNIVNANSFSDAVKELIAQNYDPEVEPDIRTIHRVGEDLSFLIEDPFMAGLLWNELMSAMTHLIQTDYDTSSLTALIAAAKGQEVENIH